MRAPASAPFHDGGLDKEAEFAAMKAKMELLELAETRRQAESERRQAEFEALHADNKRLLREVWTLLLAQRVAVCAKKLSTVLATTLERRGTSDFDSLKTLLSLT